MQLNYDLLTIKKNKDYRPNTSAQFSIYRNVMKAFHESGSQRLKAYLFHELSHDAVPFLSLRVVNAVHVIWHQSDGVLEANLAGDPLQQIDAEPLEPGVPRQILVFLHHDVRLLLGKVRPPLMDDVV